MLKKINLNQCIKRVGRIKMYPLLLKNKFKGKEKRAELLQKRKAHAIICTLFVSMSILFGGACTAQASDNLQIENAHAEQEPEKEKHATPILYPIGEVFYGDTITVNWEPVPTATNGYIVYMNKIVDNAISITFATTAKRWDADRVTFYPSSFKTGQTLRFSVVALETQAYAKSLGGTTNPVIVQKAQPQLLMNNQSARLEKGRYRMKYRGYSSGEKWFTSSDESVATINNKGILTLQGVGTTKITLQFLENENYLGGTVSANLVVKNTHTVVEEIAFENPVEGQEQEISFNTIPTADNGYVIQVLLDGRNFKKVANVPQIQGESTVRYTIPGKYFQKKKKVQVRIKALETETHLTSQYAYSKKWFVIPQKRK